MWVFLSKDCQLYSYQYETNLVHVFTSILNKGFGLLWFFHNVVVCCFCVVPIHWYLFILLRAYYYSNFWYFLIKKIISFLLKQKIVNCILYIFPYNFISRRNARWSLMIFVVTFWRNTKFTSEKNITIYRTFITSFGKLKIVINYFFWILILCNNEDI